MSPDPDNENPLTRPGHDDVADVELVLMDDEDPDEDEGDEEEDDDEDEDGEGDRSSFSLDTPEPSPVVTADSELVPKGKGKGKLDGKKRKGKLKGKAADGLAIEIDDKALGLDDEKSSELSAYDRDEVTAPEADEFSALELLFGASEQPWKNETLSEAERTSLLQVYRNKDAMAQQAAEAGELDPAGRAQKNNSNLKQAATATAVVGAGVLAAKTAEAMTPGHKSATLKTDIKQQAQHQATHATSTAKIVEHDIRIEHQHSQHEEETTASKMDKDLSTAMGIGVRVGMPTSLSLMMKSTAENNQVEKNYMGLAQHIALSQPEYRNEIAWNPRANNTVGDTFVQAIKMIYEGLGFEALMNVSPYRAAGWDEKRMEQKQNMTDITLAPAREMRQGPAPEPSLNREYRMTPGPTGPG